MNSFPTPLTPEQATASLAAGKTLFRASYFSSFGMILLKGDPPNLDYQIAFGLHATPEAANQHAAALGYHRSKQ